MVSFLRARATPPGIVKSTSSAHDAGTSTPADVSDADAFATHAESWQGKLAWVRSVATRGGEMGVYEKPLPFSYRMHRRVVAEDSNNAYFTHDFATWLDKNATVRHPSALSNSAKMSCFDYVYLCMYGAGHVDVPALRGIYRRFEQQLNSPFSGHTACYEALGSEQAVPLDANAKRGDILFFWRFTTLAHVAILTQPGENPQQVGLWTNPDTSVSVAPTDALGSLRVHYTPFEEARSALTVAAALGGLEGGRRPLAASKDFIRAEVSRINTSNEAQLSSLRTLALLYLASCTVFVLASVIVGFTPNSERHAVGFVSANPGLKTT